MNSILYLREIGSDLHRINEYIIMFFYIYKKIRESSYLIEITTEIHVVNIFKLKILIAINIVNFRKKEIIPLNTIKEIPIRIKKKLNNNRDFLFLFKYPNAICYIMNSNFLFI
jgi:hypothetical protein